MSEMPKSLTVIVQVRCNTEPGQVQLLLDKVLERAADLRPELQQILVDFASELNKVERPRKEV